MMMKATKTEKSDWMDRYIVRCLLQGVVLAILLLGGLYLYMNRFDYLSNEGVHLRINKLTGERCVNFVGDELLKWDAPWTCRQPGQN